MALGSHRGIQIAQPRLVPGQQGQPLNVIGALGHRFAQFVHQIDQLRIGLNRRRRIDPLGIAFGHVLAGAAVIGVLGGGKAGGQWQIRGAGRALAQIQRDCTGNQRQQDQPGPQPVSHADHRAVLRHAAISIQNLAPDFGAQPLGVARADNAAFQIAVHFAQLIAINAQIKGCRRFRRRATAQQGQGDCQRDDCRQGAADDPERHRYLRHWH